MIRRGLWLGTGVAVGAGGGLWLRRRAELLARQARDGSLVARVPVAAGSGARWVGRQVRTAVAQGAADAHRREDELRLRWIERVPIDAGTVGRSGGERS